MRTWTEDELKDLELRGFYQDIIGKTLRKYQWENLKYEIKGQFPDRPLDKDLLGRIGNMRKKSPKWRIDSIGLQIFTEAIDNIPATGMKGASVYILVKKICKYQVSDRTIHQWFYDVANHCQMFGNYTKEQVIKICDKALLSQPRPGSLSNG